MIIPPEYPSNHHEGALLEPYTYVCSNPGKEMRTELIEAFNVWIKVPPVQLVIITKVIKMLHTASLLVDDIEDDSVLRRGEPVAHKIFGIPATINCANYVYFMALDELSQISNPKMLTIFIETGGLLRLAVKLMQAAAGDTCQEDYVHMVEMIGIHFQIRDDYLNLQSTQYSANKGFCEDLTEGKFSFPIIHSIRADTKNRKLLNILKQKPTEPELKVYAVSLMKATKTFEYCRERMSFYEERARAELRRLGGNPRLEKIIDRLSIPDPTLDANKNMVPVFALSLEAKK
ncbi:geranylgeranyl pyrophosphate synthetase [Modicella reniformis]|uniref:Geranylgeranyl pyrophosphate synthetase n=1 Tax=Modicella reniformis TaxID=1440133 RepID=A0A9P6M0E8_9FUNG|nr:geranylgeranyl pyrophosphate synthetase [Modicella reniformis]